METRSLRFVILCDSLDLPLWQANCIRDAVSHGVAEPVGVVLRAPAPRVPEQSKWRRRWRNRKLVLWRIFNRLYVDKKTKANRATPCEADFARVPIITENPIRSSVCHEALSASALEFIESVRPDFILRFGFGILEGEVLRAARYGVWSYHHGNPLEYRGQPPGFWEIVAGSPVVGAVLQVLGEELDAGSILHRGHFQTTLHSYAKTRDTLYLGSSSWVRRACSDILCNGWKVQSEPESSSASPIFREPRNQVVLQFIFNAAINFMRTQITYKLYRQTWNCGVIAAPIDVVAGLRGEERKAEALGTVHWMPIEAEAFRADPFAYELNDDGDIRILVERFDWSARVGSIVAIDYDGSQFGSPKPVLSAITHLSYPFIIKDRDTVRFVPEHSAVRDVSAYQIDIGGRAYSRTSLLVDRELIDATIFKWRDAYWMFALEEMHTKNTDLHIYFSDRLEGPWTSHPLNPVKTDVRNARPGGTPFEYEGKLYRPAQDCSTHYGSAIVVNEIQELSETKFEERPVSRVQPLSGGAYEHGLHTLSHVGALTLIDGSRKERMPLWKS